MIDELCILIPASVRYCIIPYRTSLLYYSTTYYSIGYSHIICYIVPVLSSTKNTNYQYVFSDIAL